MAQQPLLTFISDDKLYQYVKIMVDAVGTAKKKIGKNPYSSVIDPFSAVVDSSIQGISLEDWMDQEKARKIQKALQNAVGEFHQNILGSMPGWENAGRGGSFDVRNKDRKIIAEIKNKYNTLNSSSFLAMYTTLSNHLDYGDRGFTAYYVPIITKNPLPFDKTFSPPRRGVSMPIRNDLRTMDGKSFYSLASGDPNALANLYRVLPKALEHVLGKKINVSKSGIYKDTLEKLDDMPVQAVADSPLGTFPELFLRTFGN